MNWLAGVFFAGAILCALLGFEEITKPAPKETVLMTNSQAKKTVKALLRHPQRVSFLKIEVSPPKFRSQPKRLSDWKYIKIRILRPPAKTDYTPFIGWKRPPYARALFSYWGPEQWQFSTRPRWTFVFELGRNWDRWSGRLIIFGRVWWYSDNWSSYSIGSKQPFVSWREVLMMLGHHHFRLFLEELAKPA